ncbi:MAG: glutathione S-transferase family protein [Bdellovibrionales bacterium]|nr:glutathione S-transferase family protein [Bdellovibrionales bacterium]
MRVRMTLHEKNIPFETVEEDLKNFSIELRKHHPEAKVPVLIHGENILYESAIITEYLEDTFPTPKLMPDDPYIKAQMRLWTYWCNQHFKHHVDHYKYGTSRSAKEDVENAPKMLTEDLQKLEKALSKHPFLLGNTLTLADIHVFPFFRQLTKTTPLFEPLHHFEACQKWLESILERPSFKKTMEQTS